MSLSFIDEFLDLTSNMPPKIDRLLKLINEVDEKSVNMSKKMAESRKNYISKIKALKGNNDEQLKSELEKLRHTISQNYTDSMSLSETKLGALKEIRYILFNEDYKKQLDELIKKGEEECKNQIQFDNLSNTIHSAFDKKYADNYSNSSGTAPKRKITERSLKYTNKDKSILGKKKNRSKEKKLKKMGQISNFNSEALDAYEMQPTISEFKPEEDTKLYCTCGGQSSGNMIACDNPKCPIEWFHMVCVGFKEEDQLNDSKWYCSKDCEEEAKKNEEHGNRDNSDKKVIKKRKK